MLVSSFYNNTQSSPWDSVAHFCSRVFSEGVQSKKNAENDSSVTLVAMTTIGLIATSFYVFYYWQRPLKEGLGDKAGCGLENKSSAVYKVSQEPFTSKSEMITPCPENYANLLFSVQEGAPHLKSDPKKELFDGSPSRNLNKYYSSSSEDDESDAASEISDISQASSSGESQSSESMLQEV